MGEQTRAQNADYVRPVAPVTKLKPVSVVEGMCVCGHPFGWHRTDRICPIGECACKNYRYVGWPVSRFILDPERMVPAQNDGSGVDDA